MRRAVITGVGPVTPSVIGSEAFWRGLVAGRSAVERITLFDPSAFRSQMAGEVRSFAPEEFIEARHLKRMDRYSQFAVSAGRLALDDAKLNPVREERERIGVSIGSVLGGLGHAEVQVGVFNTRGLRSVDPMLALREAGTSPAEIDYINAHGSSTPLNDRTETLAIKRIFGERAYTVPISSIKGYHDHALGAAGAMEAAACALMLERQYLVPTVNPEMPDPECDLDFLSRVGRPHPVRTILSNSFGFGGRRFNGGYGKNGSM